MTLRVYANISPSNADPTGGIGQVVLALYKYLPEHDVQLVSIERGFDLLYVKQ